MVSRTTWRFEYCESVLMSIFRKSLRSERRRSGRAQAAGVLEEGAHRIIRKWGAKCLPEKML